MATTRLIPMHKIKNQSIAYTVHKRINYAINPAKTLCGELVTTYGCDPATAANEMLLTKRAYADFTGREIPDSDVLLYQIRQSFKPGEVTPEQAQQIGYELAMTWTKGKHQFVVATHIDHAHIHTHIIYNATKIDARHKYRNFLGSSFALRRASDRLCLENGLSIVEKHQITVLISSHMLDELSRLATHYGFIDGGRMVKEISAQELEAACRKCVRLEVSNVKALARVLDGMNVDYNIISDTMADVYAKINVSKFTMLLSKENCEVISIQEKDESLESYYVGLVGGKDNE